MVTCVSLFVTKSLAYFEHTTCNTGFVPFSCSRIFDHIWIRSRSTSICSSIIQSCSAILTNTNSWTAEDLQACEKMNLQLSDQYSESKMKEKGDMLGRTVRKVLVHHW